jgi:hypothetical protein
VYNVKKAKGTAKMKKAYVTIFALMTLQGCSWMTKDYKEPNYTVLKKEATEKHIEFRRYSETIVAEVTVDGDHNEATSKGFRLLADYIFGNNITNNKMEMTAPVTQQATSTKMEMTIPVSQEKTENGLWKVRFFMPTEYNLETLPKPNNNKVNLISVPPYHAAAIQFSGRWTEANFYEHRRLLEAHLKNTNVTTEGEAIYAYYNAPITPWFLRRNEVIIRIQNNE